MAKSSFALLLLLCLAGLSTQARGELIVNGSFETPVLGAGTFANYSNGSTAISGWTVVGNGLDDVAVVERTYFQNGITFQSQDGNQHIDLAGVASNNPTSGVTQDVATNVGGQYELRFHVGSMTDGVFFFPGTIDLSIDGGPRTSYTNPTAPSDHIDWLEFIVPFTAQNATTSITFFNGSAANNYNSSLDNVSLQAVPEPSSLMLVAGLVGGAWWKRRRNAPRACRSTCPQTSTIARKR